MRASFLAKKKVTSKDGGSGLDIDEMIYPLILIRELKRCLKGSLRVPKARVF